jgi:hypothetical protein
MRVTVFFPAVLLCLSAGTGAIAQDRQSISYDVAAAETKYSANYRVTVGDVPEHLLRVFELRRTFARRPPIFQGVTAKEMWERGSADTIDQNGSESSYVTYLLEDGSKVFGRYTGIITSFRWPDGSRHFDVLGVIALNGGTGSFACLRGTVRVRASLDPGADSNQIESKGEYWMEGCLPGHVVTP